MNPNVNEIKSKLLHLPLYVGIDASPKSTSPNTRLDLLSNVKGPGCSSPVPSCITKEYSLGAGLSSGWSIAGDQN